MTFINYLKGYKVVLSLVAQKQMNNLNKNDALRISRKLENLVSGGQSIDVKKLVDAKGSQYRLRVGNYRVIYEIWKKQIIVMVINIEHRKTVYKKRSR